MIVVLYDDSTECELVATRERFIDRRKYGCRVLDSFGPRLPLHVMLSMMERLHILIQDLSRSRRSYEYIQDNTDGKTFVHSRELLPAPTDSRSIPLSSVW